jgi:hypothetical protein
MSAQQALTTTHKPICHVGCSRNCRSKEESILCTPNRLTLLVADSADEKAVAALLAKAESIALSRVLSIQLHWFCVMRSCAITA